MGGYERVGRRLVSPDPSARPVSAEDRRFVFSLPEDQALALIELGVVLERHTKRSSPLDKATVALDEQRAKQIAPWERCDKCGGSGWIEDGP